MAVTLYISCLIFHHYSDVKAAAAAAEWTGTLLNGFLKRLSMLTGKVWLVQHLLFENQHDGFKKKKRKRHQRCISRFACHKNGPLKFSKNPEFKKKAAKHGWLSTVLENGLTVSRLSTAPEQIWLSGLISE